jgi:hypothetical protein
MYRLGAAEVEIYRCSVKADREIIRSLALAKVFEFFGPNLSTEITSGLCKSKQLGFACGRRNFILALQPVMTQDIHILWRVTLFR